MEEKKKQVEVMLNEIDALNVPVLEVYNKIDLVDNIMPGFEERMKG